MAHHAEVIVENYVFSPETKKKLVYLLITGIALVVLGVVLAMMGGGHDEHGGGQAANASQEMVASVQQHEAASPGHEVAAGEHHGSPVWLKRVYTTLWMNNIFFVGAGIIGLFFVAIQYAAMAGWSVGVKRIGIAMGTWIPIAGILTLALWFLTHHDIFHWSHGSSYGEKLPSGQTNVEFDKIIDGKGPFFFWPLASGSFPIFFIFRIVLFFGVWYWFLIQIRKNMLEEDINASTTYWHKNQVLSTVFLIFFGISSSIAAWDWVMSIDTHWFSTMFGWYVFASWWVTGLAIITLIAAFLKDAGYLKIVNSNHMHDLGKFVWAFSIFWTYIWFSQFLLIYYAHIPEETVYFVERMKNSPYGWIFYTNIILNFALPFLLFMTRDSKRQLSTLKLVCPIIIIGHWFDFYNMVTPGVMQHDGALGFIEIGTALIFLSAFLFVTLTSLTKLPLFGKNDPMLEESLHHHI
ncbi:MAG TPA: hypothetical protein VK589_20360 [Chryseolinea sp.]|nr:hypothetical protein [Chryseolinea sp.]